MLSNNYFLSRVFFCHAFANTFQQETLQYSHSKCALLIQTLQVIDSLDLPRQRSQEIVQSKDSVQVAVLRVPAQLL